MPTELISLLWLTLVLGTPLVLAGLAGLFSERSGVINIGLEGMMLASACAMALGCERFGLPVGLLFAAGTGVALSLLHWYATQRLSIDHIVSGMAINALAAGGTNFFFQRFSDPEKSSGFAVLPVPVFIILAFVLAALIAFVATRTQWGLRLWAVGNDPDKSRQAGIKPGSIRFTALIGTGLLCAIAGCMLVSDTGGFTDNMTAGRGYIALAALILAGWRPIPTLITGLAFGFFSAVKVVFQGNAVAGISLPSEAWAALPYLVTLIALGGFLGKNRGPLGLGKP